MRTREGESWLARRFFSLISTNLSYPSGVTGSPSLRLLPGWQLDSLQNGIGSCLPTFWFGALIFSGAFAFVLAWLPPKYL